MYAVYAHNVETTEGLTRGTKQLGESVWRPFVRLSGVLWLEFTGVFFGIFAVFRSIYGGLGCATPSATQAYLASKTRRSGRVAALSALSSSFGLGTIIGPAVAPIFVLPVVGLAGPLFAFAAIALVVVVSIVRWLPNDRRGRKAGVCVMRRA